MVYIILGAGFEEIEALTPCDLLRRAGVEVKLAGIGGMTVTGGHGISVVCDCTVDEADFAAAEMVVVPGGLGGVASIEACPIALEKISAAGKAGVCTAAICAGPGVLARLGILAGHRAVCYPGMEGEMTGADMQPGVPAVTDGTVVTGRAAGASVQFALELIKYLRGEAAAQDVADRIYFDVR